MMSPVGRLWLLRGVRKEELISAMAWLTMPALLGPVCGPPLGGILTDVFGWRAVFWINVPIGLIGFLLVAWKIPAIPPTNPGKPDVLGLALVGLALALGMFGLETVGRHVVADPWPGVALMTGIVIGVAAYLHCRRATRSVDVAAKSPRRHAARLLVVSAALSAGPARGRCAPAPGLSCRRVRAAAVIRGHRL